jgi:predicted permease
VRFVEKLCLRWRSLVRRRGLDQELDEELRFHLDQQIAENLAGGMRAEEARYAARRAIGGAEQIKQECRDMRRVRLLDDLLRDLGHGARMLAKRPGFTAVAVLTLALGIGANVAVFSLFETVLIRMLPVRDPQELFVVYETGPGETDRAGVSYLMFQRLRDALGGRAELMAQSYPAHFTAVTPNGAIEGAQGQLISGEYSSVLGVRPALGRLLAMDDVRADATAVAVISYSWWQRHYGGDRGIVGKVIRLNGTPLTIVGVAQPGFFGMALGEPVDVWLPVTVQAQVRYYGNVASAYGSDPRKPWLPQQDIRWLQLVVRARDVQAAQTALATMNVVFRRDLERMAQGRDARESGIVLQHRLFLQPGGRGFSGLQKRLSAPVRVLMAMATVALVITCANLAGLLLVRASARQKEMAIRQSMGAGRARLIRQLLTESALLASVSTAIALLIARWANAALPRFLSIDLEIHFDYWLLAFTVALSIAATALFGLAPALSTSNVDLGAGLRSGAVSRGRRSLTTGKVLIVAQMALSFVLVTGAVLLSRTLWNLLSTDLGFDREHVITVRVDPRAGGYATDRLASLYEAMVDRVRGLPGVRSAAVSESSLAGGGVTTSAVFVPGYTPKPNENISAMENYVDPGYFATVGMQLLSGRDFDRRDGPQAQQVAIVNEAMAQNYFGTLAAVGRSYRYGAQGRDFEIIGVVRDAKIRNAWGHAAPMAYRPLRQQMDYVQSLEVRTAGDPRAVLGQVRKAIAEVAPNLPGLEVATLAERVDRTLTDERLLAEIAALFGVFSLLLASLGIYGLLSYAVAQRTAEIGIRMAIGARQSVLLGLFLREGLSLVVAGLAGGLALALSGVRLIASVLFGVAANDPITLAGVAGVMLAVALAAIWVPARRAAHVDPMVALRHE